MLLAIDSGNTNTVFAIYDGNELLILKGSSKTFASKKLKSCLVELDESRSDYQESLDLIQGTGLKLRTKLSVAKEGPFSTTFNHIFVRND